MTLPYQPTQNYKRVVTLQISINTAINYTTGYSQLNYLIMYKIMVHIKNENTYIDNNVCVQIELPAVPRKGEILYLQNDLKQVLEDKVKSNLKIAREYAPKWFYGHSYNCEEPKQENLKDISFDDAINVDSVAFEANSEIIHIELDISKNDDGTLSFIMRFYNGGTCLTECIEEELEKLQ